MIYLRLFTAFIKIGFTSFGGMSMIPVIMQEMKVNQWMTAEDLTNLIAIAEMTPGPLGINCATFAGMQTAGVLGGIAAVMGVLMPAYTLTLVSDTSNFVLFQSACMPVRTTVLLAAQINHRSEVTNTMILIIKLRFLFPEKFLLTR